jgi:hypothetical protein
MENMESKLEEKIEIKMKKIEDIDLRFHNGEISKKEYSSKKKHIEEIIKKMNIDLRMLRGEVAKRKRLVEDKNKRKKRLKPVESNYLIAFKNLNIYKK